jgi:hypothetical protein
MFFLSLFYDHDQGLQQVSNNVDWYYIALAVLIGSAALSHGVSRVFMAWEKELSLARWFSVIGDIFGIILATALSCVVGHITWSWALAGTTGLVGAFSSALVLSLVRAKLGVKQDEPSPESKTSV